MHLSPWLFELRGEVARDTSVASFHWIERGTSLCISMCVCVCGGGENRVKVRSYKSRGMIVLVICILNICRHVIRKHNQICSYKTETNLFFWCTHTWDSGPSQRIAFFCFLSLLLTVQTRKGDRELLRKKKGIGPQLNATREYCRNMFLLHIWKGLISTFCCCVNVTFVFDLFSEVGHNRKLTLNQTSTVRAIPSQTKPVGSMMYKAKE